MPTAKNRSARVHAEVEPRRNLPAESTRHEADAPRRDENSERAAGEREQHALGEQMPNDLLARCAERESDGDFLLSLRAARQQKAGEIRAHDEEHEADGAEHDAA